MIKIAGGPPGFEKARYCPSGLHAAPQSGKVARASESSSKSRRVTRVRFRSSPSWISSSSRPRGAGCGDPIDSGTNRPKAKDRPTGLQEGAVKGQADSSIRTEDWVAVWVAQIWYDIRPEDPLGSIGC